MSKKLINVVLDLETLGISEDAAIIQIGCCIPQFDRIHLPEGISYEFEATIKYEDCLNSEFAKDSATMEWWEQQDPRARKHVFSGQDSYVDAFDQFVFWLGSVRANGSDVAIWGNGADFDNRLLSYSLASFGFNNVWSFRNNRCLRTIKAIFPVSDNFKYDEDWIKHTAIGDASYEAKLLDEINFDYSLDI